MANLIAWRLSTAVTDPDLNAWFDARGSENGDKCAFNFGTTLTAANGSLFNVMVGARQYLLQQNWVNVKAGFCALSYP
jgi:hypothetical protein